MTPTLLAMTGLAVLAALPRLLTLLSLWQLKEWRIDRLREHLRGEGWMTQLFGVNEPLLIAFLLGIAALPRVPVTAWTLAALLLLAGHGGLKFMLRRQPFPVWTQKAMILCLVSGVVLAAAAFRLLLLSPLLLPVLPILCPVAVLCAWLLFKPVDVVMKRRILCSAEAARARHPDMTVIGIAGSVGKTTTKELIAHLLKETGAIATPAHVNTELGVAKWLLGQLRKKDAEALETLIVEMGAYRQGEIALLARIIRPRIGVVTHIGQDHLALFGSEEAICAANAELLDALPADGHAFLNADSDACETLRTHCACAVTTVGTGGHADIEAFDIEETADGLRFRVGETLFSVPLHGTHNVTNILLAIGVATERGISPDDIAARLRTFTPPKHTFEIRNENGVTVLDDTHNASPQSFRAAVEWARTQPHERKILLTSGIIELGEDEANIHTELGALARPVFSDAYILNNNFIHYFALGFGKENLHGPQQSTRANRGELLVCVGRMKPSVLQSFLP